MLWTELFSGGTIQDTSSKFSHLHVVAREQRVSAGPERDGSARVTEKARGSCGSFDIAQDENRKNNTLEINCSAACQSRGLELDRRRLPLAHGNIASDRRFTGFEWAPGCFYDPVRPEVAARCLSPVADPD